MKHFSTFSQRPSPQAPWDPSPEQELVLAIPGVVLTALYDQMATQLCPFEISNFTFGHSGIHRAGERTSPFFHFPFVSFEGSTIAHFPFFRTVI